MCDMHCGNVLLPCSCNTCFCTTSVVVGGGGAATLTGGGCIYYNLTPAESVGLQATKELNDVDHENMILISQILMGVGAFMILTTLLIIVLSCFRRRHRLVQQDPEDRTRLKDSDDDDGTDGTTSYGSV